MGKVERRGEFIAVGFWSSWAALERLMHATHLLLPHRLFHSLITLWKPLGDTRVKTHCMLRKVKFNGCSWSWPISPLDTSRCSFSTTLTVFLFYLTVYLSYFTAFYYIFQPVSQWKKLEPPLLPNLRKCKLCPFFLTF